MPYELACRGKFSKPVADHILNDEYLNVLFPVMHAERVTDHLRGDDACAGPRLDHVALFRIKDFLEEFCVRERTFLH